jgi:CBS domain-containing protein
MKSNSVKNLMIPLSEFATISEAATLYDAVIALEKDREAFDQNRYRHRTVFVHDGNNRIVGKVGQFDVIHALEPKYEEIGDQISLSRFGYTPLDMKSLLKEYKLWNQPLNDICPKANQYKIKSFMHTPTEGEYVDENATLDEAINQILIGRHQSLLVTRGKDIVGILRQTDVYMEIVQTIKACKL